MILNAVPRIGDVIKVLTESHHDDLCIVKGVLDGVATVAHSINEEFVLPLSAIVVMVRPAQRDNVK